MQISGRRKHKVLKFNSCNNAELTEPYETYSTQEGMNKKNGFHLRWTRIVTVICTNGYGKRTKEESTYDVYKPIKGPVLLQRSEVWTEDYWLSWTVILHEKNNMQTTITIQVRNYFSNRFIKGLKSSSYRYPLKYLHSSGYTSYIVV